MNRSDRNKNLYIHSVAFSSLLMFVSMQPASAGNGDRAGFREFKQLNQGIDRNTLHALWRLNYGRGPRAAEVRDGGGPIYTIPFIPCPGRTTHGGSGIPPVRPHNLNQIEVAALTAPVFNADNTINAAVIGPSSSPSVKVVSGLQASPHLMERNAVFPAFPGGTSAPALLTSSSDSSPSGFNQFQKIDVFSGNAQANLGIIESTLKRLPETLLKCPSPETEK